MRSSVARLTYLFAIAVAMIGWSWLLLHSLAWAFDL
ncbi:hypothetical protein V1292_006647 [Bradyrhizobium sp. AZCC 1719]